MKTKDSSIASSDASQRLLDVWLVELVLPSFLPYEVSLKEVFERLAVEKVVERPTGGEMTDDEDALAAPAQQDIVEAAPHPMDGLLPALAVGIRCGEVVSAHGVDLRGRRAIERAIIAFAKSPIKEHGSGVSRERKLDRLDRPTQVRCKHSCQAIGHASLTEFACEDTTAFG